MPILALIAALGAALFWAVGSLIAHFPAQVLGALVFTRIQLITSSLLLGIIVYFAGTWGTIVWDYWGALAVSSLVSVVLGNLFMIACLRRGGPRRMQLLFALNAPLAAILSYIFLGETLSLQMSMGCLLALGGVVLAIVYGNQPLVGLSKFETVQGSLLWVIVFGVLSAICQAIGLITIKPVMLAGTDPLAASFLRTGGAALVLLAVSPLLTARNALTARNGAVISTEARISPKLLIWTIFPGFLGYVCAVSMILYALNNYETGVVAVLGSTAPVMLLPIIWWRTKRCPLLPAWVGALLTVAGAGLIANG